MQFYYSREEHVQPKEGDTEVKVIKRKDSFDMESVKRTLEYDTNKIVVLLNDGHEENREVPIANKQGKVTGSKNMRRWISSEIYLNEADTARYWSLTQHQGGTTGSVINRVDPFPEMAEAE